MFLWKYREQLQTLIPSGSLRERFVKGAFWSLAGLAMLFGLDQAARVVAARFLGTVGFGELGMIRSTVAMFGVFSGLSLGLTATKHVAEFRLKNPSRAGTILGMSSSVALCSGALMSGIIFLLTPYLATHAFDAPHLIRELRIACALLFMNTLVRAQSGALAGFEAFKTIARINLWRGLLIPPLMLVGVYLWGVSGALFALAAGAAVTWFLNHAALENETRKAAISVRYLDFWREFPVLWKFSLPGLLGNIVTTPASWAARTLLFRFNQADGRAQMGIFEAANGWRLLVLIMPTALAPVLVSILSERLGAGDVKRARKVLLAGMFAAGVVAIPLAGGLSLFSRQIMSLCGSAFVEGWPVLVAVLATAALLALLSPVSQIIAASGKMWLGVLMNAGWAAVLLGSFTMLRGMGALGLALSFLLAYAVHATWTFGFAYAVTRPGRLSVGDIEKIGAVSEPIQPNV